LKVGELMSLSGNRKFAMIQDIEKFGPELKFFRLSYSNTLDRRKVPIGIARANGDVASCTAERCTGEFGFCVIA
jgi:hypothetical protein